MIRKNHLFLHVWSAVTMMVMLHSCSDQMGSWKYDHTLRVEDKTGVGAKHFPVSFELNTARLISEGKMRSDGADIRITIAGTEAPYQIDGINSDRTLITFQVELKPGESRDDIILHYGNPFAQAPKNDTYWTTNQSSDDSIENALIRVWVSHDIDEEVVGNMKTFQSEHMIKRNNENQLNGKGILKVATCQFPVAASVEENGKQIRRQILAAKRRGADVAHFPEYALCGYPGKDFESWGDFDWDMLESESLAISRLAAQEKIWVIFGSAHRLSGDHLPHNSLYVIDPQGRIVDRYDKRFCSPRELDKFSPGDHFSVVTINGVRCGLLICADSRYPELYRQYKKLGVDLLFQSFHLARAPGPNVLTTVMPATMQARAATNYFWISAPNSSAYYQSFPSLMIQPDGVLVDSLMCNREGVMVNEVNVREELYDASRLFRERAMTGILNSGHLVQDSRSTNRKEF